MARSTAPPVVMTVGAALDMARAGRFRVPDFHRPFVWSLEQIIPFFESVVAGLPTGAIVAFEREAAAAEVQLGPLRIAAPADPLALWVVDGAQRLGAIAGVLLAGGRPPHAFRLSYDLASDQIHAGTTADARPTRIPLDVLADVADLTKWLDEHEATAARFAEKVAGLRERILGYPLVLTRLLDPTGESAVEIFMRLNANGVTLSGADLDRARHPVAAVPGPEPLADRLRSAGLGRPPVETVVEAVRAALGPEPANQDLAFVIAEPALSAALRWLRREGEIPHLTVWPGHLSLLPILARFFHLNQQPSARARILLRRWLWRAMGQDHGRVAAAAYEAISGEDSTDANRLLQHFDAHRPSPSAYLAEVGRLLALSELSPRSLVGGSPLDVRALLEIHGLAAFRELGGVPVLSPPDEGPLDELVRAAEVKPDLLAGHALDRHMLARLASGDVTGFREQRHLLLADRLLGISDRLAEWDASDRPAISALVIEDDDHGF